jgi:2-phospho-L-lactate guanylyltransferase
VLGAPAGVALSPRFGPGSYLAHVAGGAVPVNAAASVRRDVDTLDDLSDAQWLGVGAHTAAALRGLAG